MLDECNRVGKMAPSGRLVGGGGCRGRCEVEGPSAGCRQQQLPCLLVSPPCWPLATSCLPPAANTLCRLRLHATQKGWGRLQKVGSGQNISPELAAGLASLFLWKTLESRKAQVWQLLVPCPWEGQGYTALLLPRRPAAAGPEKLRLEREMPAACKRFAISSSSSETK